MKMKLIVSVVVGYMYKVTKNRLDTSKFRKEFAAIRHGDYYDFLNRIGEEIDFVASYNRGVISTRTNINVEDYDFERLIKIGKSLRNFHNDCITQFGTIEDNDIPDNTFEELTLFELSLRMHINNKRLTNERIHLVEVIDKIQIQENLTTEEKEILHLGRKFLNKVKRPWQMKTSWEKGINEFNAAFELTQRKGITII